MQADFYSLSVASKTNSSAIEPFIYTVRGQKVILDSDLARLYSVETKRLNEQLRRNKNRFPKDFVFQISESEWNSLRSQNATLDAVVGRGDAGRKGASKGSPSKHSSSLRSQFATLKKERGQHRKYLPFVFTEHGALQAANILNSKKAAAMSIYVIRAFVKMRQLQSIGDAILKRLAEIDTTLLTHDAALRDIYERLRPLLAPPPERPKKEIGFHVKNAGGPAAII